MENINCSDSELGMLSDTQVTPKCEQQMMLMWASHFKKLISFGIFMYEWRVDGIRCNHMIWHTEEDRQEAPHAERRYGDRSVKRKVKTMPWQV